MNQSLLSNFFLTVLLCIGINSFSQISEYYFTDTIGERQCEVNKTLRSDNAMYIAGTSYDHNWMQPSIIKLDFDGNKIWSTTEHDDYIVESSVQHEVIDMVLTDSYLCALVKLWHPSTAYYLWKVDVNTGEIVKKVTMTFNTIEPPVALTEYTDEFAILSYGFESYLPKAFTPLKFEIKEEDSE